MSEDNKPRNKVLPTKLPTAFEHEANLPKAEVHDYSALLPEDNKPGSINKPAAPGAHISDKVYWFPESYNALRKELYENWPAVWETVGWSMAFESTTFVELMDYILLTKTTFDTNKVSAICHKYLNLLRAKRGLAPIAYETGNLILNPQTGVGFSPVEIEALAQDAKRKANELDTDSSNASSDGLGDTRGYEASDSSAGSRDASQDGQPPSEASEGRPSES